MISAIAVLSLLNTLQTNTPAQDTALKNTPHRVYQGADGRLSDFEAMSAAAAGADILFFGEQHDDPGTHRLERALLESVARRRKDVVVSMEMFERDVQGVLDQYLAGSITEAVFLAAARPWPNYAADYRPIVEFAKSQGWRVVAANIPRPMAMLIASKGIDTLNALRDSIRRWAAAEYQCPPGRYFDNFVVAMGGHGGETGDAAARNQRYYTSQCLKDETMAEAIVNARAASGGKALVIHYNGAFHSDFGDGTAERVRRRIPGASVVVVSAQPSADLDVVPKAADLQKGDWVVVPFRAKKP